MIGIVLVLLTGSTGFTGWEELEMPTEEIRNWDLELQK
jgi:hypothetical protein